MTLSHVEAAALAADERRNELQLALHRIEEMTRCIQVVERRVAELTAMAEHYCNALMDIANGPDATARITALSALYPRRPA